MSPAPTTANVTSPRAGGYAVRLDDVYLRLAPGQGRTYEIGFDRLQAGRVDTASSTEELVSEFGQVFARSDFTSGEGLDRAHRRDNPEDAGARYWASAGVDIIAPRGGSPARLTLLRTGPRLYSTASLGPAVAFDAKLFSRTSANLNQLAEMTSPTATVSVALTDPHNGEGTSGTTVPLAGPVVLGEYLYVGLGTNGVHRRQRGGSTWAHWSDLRVDGLWSVKNRIIGSYQGTLYEVGSLATSTTLHTLGGTTGLGTAGRWDVVADAGAVILASGSATSSSSSVLHAFAPNTSGVLTIASQQVQAEREMIADIVTIYGATFYTTVPDIAGTEPGKLWSATVSEQNVLNDITLLKDFSLSEAELSTGRKLTADGTNVYVGGLDASDLKPRLWRLDAITQGVHRYTDFEAATSSSATYPPAPLFALGRMFLTDAGGLHRISTTDYVSSGYLISPLADFATATAKEWVGASLSVESVASGTEVELYYSTDPAAIEDPAHVSWRRAKRISSGTDDTETTLSGATGRELAGMLKLVTTSTTITPTARSFSFRGFPGDSDMLLEIPVDVSDVLERPGKAITRARGRGNALWLALAARQGDDAVLELLDTGMTLRGVVEDVAAPVPTRSWRGGQMLHATIRFRGRSVSSEGTGEAGGEGAFGWSTLGTPPTLGTTP